MKRAFFQIIALIGAVLGFSTEVVAQYGAPPVFGHVHYKIEIGDCISDQDTNSVRLNVSVNGVNYSSVDVSDGFTSSFTYDLGWYDERSKIKLSAFPAERYKEILSADSAMFKFKVSDKAKEGKEYCWGYNYTHKDTIVLQLECLQPKIEIDTILEPIPDTLVIEEKDSLDFEEVKKIASNGLKPDDIDMILFPVPSQTEVNIRLLTEGKTDANMTWYNMAGQLIYEEKLHLQTHDELLVYNISSFARGTYFIAVVLEDGRHISKKFIKQ